jgi:hypothetical protein
MSMMARSSSVRRDASFFCCFASSVISRFTSILSFLMSSAVLFACSIKCLSTAISSLVAWASPKGLASAWIDW